MSKNKIVSENFEEKSNVNRDKKTKEKSNAQKVLPILIVVIISLIVVLTCVLIAYYQVYKSGKQNANILEGIYTSSYYSMVDNVNNLSVDLAKYGTLSDTQAKQSKIQDIMVDTNYILSGLSLLPINEENVTSATKFFNQVNGVCEAYTKTLNSGKNLTVEQERLFDEIAVVVGKIKAKFNQQNYGMYDSNFNFVDATVFDNVGMNELSSGMGDLTSDSVEYPAMIFDGPFSTALETKQILGLKEEEISKEQAYNYLKDVVYKNRKNIKIEYANETIGDISSYDFQVTIDNKKYNAQVSKRGGLLITVSSYAESGDPIMKPEQAIEMAQTFANNIGFENMEPVWKEVNQNVVYVNLASVQNGVILYPDLVKVKVDLTSQEIIGFEALNYAFNHRERKLEFNLTESDCESNLGFDYNIIKTSQAIIKLDGGTEVCVYEYILERIDGDYFYYVNANNKKIEKVMKLVKIKDVEKLI